MRAARGKQAQTDPNRGRIEAIDALNHVESLHRHHRGPEKRSKFNKLLERNGFAASFEVAVCGDTVARNKPDPLPLLYACERFALAPAAVLMIGDSSNDSQAARAAGCPVWCVPYGYNEGLPVAALDCDRIVATLTEAAGLIAASRSRRPG